MNMKNISERYEKTWGYEYLLAMIRCLVLLFLFLSHGKEKNCEALYMCDHVTSTTLGDACIDESTKHVGRLGERRKEDYKHRRRDKAHTPERSKGERVK